MSKVTLPVPNRVKLPDTRQSMTRKSSIEGHDFYVTVGFYPDSHQIGEVFVLISKEGSTLRGFGDLLGRTISLALQHGVPWEIMSRQLMHTKFEPSGYGPRDVNGEPKKFESFGHAIAIEVTELIEQRRQLWGELTEIVEIP